MIRKVAMVLAVLIVVAALAAVVLQHEVMKKWQARYDRARVLFRAGDYGKALKALQVLEEPLRRPDRLEIAYMLGTSHSRLGDNAAARRYLERVKAAGGAAPFYLEASAELAVLSESAGSSDEALAEYERLLKTAGTSGVAPVLLLHIGMLREKRGETAEAMQALERVRREFPGTSPESEAVEKLGVLNMRMLLSPEPVEGTTFHEVMRGESLEKIAKKYSTTVEYLMEANQLSDSTVAQGKRLKVISGKFRIAVDTDANILDLTLDEHFVKRYRVGSGAAEATPLGQFKIINKEMNPVWFSDEGVFPPGHEKNILGSRWMGIDKEGYGIHGTTQPESIGKHSSAGCIRLLNQDVEELFKMMPIGTEVVIQGSSGK